MPFTSTAPKSNVPPSPSSSYSQQGAWRSQSYVGSAGGYAVKRDDYGTAKSYAAGGYGNTGGMGMDRPLPPRSGPGGYGHRPKSIDLVTPYGG